MTPTLFQNVTVSVYTPLLSRSLGYVVVQGMWADQQAPPARWRTPPASKTAWRPEGPPARPPWRRE